MKIIIYRQAKSAMQSGKVKSKKWLAKPIEETNSRSVDSLMHWVSCDDTKTQLQFEFSNKEDAIEYAVKNNFEYVNVPFAILLPNIEKSNILFPFNELMVIKGY